MYPHRSVAILAVLSLGWTVACDDGGTGGTGGGGGQSVGGEASTGGEAPGDCHATPGEPKAVLQESDGSLVQGAAITADELELFYSASRGGADVTLVAKRASRDDLFDPGVAVPEVDAACEPSDYPTFDVSADGLRLYVRCGSSVGPLRLLERASRDAVFVDRGDIGASRASPSLTRDELYLVGWDPLYGDLTAFARDTLDDPFSNAGAVVVKDYAQGIPAPALSPDGLILFFGEPMSSGTLFRSGRATREGDFEPPRMVPFDEDFVTLGSIEVGPDCHNLYFTGKTTTPRYQIYQSALGD